MALAVNVVRRSASGSQRKRIADITFDSSYATGGEALVPGDFELSQIDTLDFSHATVGGAVSSNRVQYDPVNGKLIAFNAAGTELGSASNQSTFVVRVEAAGV